MGIAEPFTSFTCPPVESIALSLASSHRVVLGLPELCMNGMSENWLLRHCGAIHWARLADALGVRPEQVAYQIQVLGVAHAQQHDRQIARDGKAP